MPRPDPRTGLDRTLTQQVADRLHHRLRGDLLLLPPLLALVALSVRRLVAPMWRDESATWAFSTLGYADLWQATSHIDRVFLPYYALVHTVRLTGAGVLGGRALSLLAGLGTILAVQLVARRLWSRTAGLLAALTVVLNPAFLVAATSLRPYALATFLSALATWIVVRRPRHLSLRVRWWLYLASVTVAAQLHLFSATVVVPHLVWLWLRVRRRVRPVAVAWAIALALTVPLAVSSSRQSKQVGWISTPTLESTIRQTAIATGSDIYYLGALTPALVTACAVLGVVSWVRRGRPNPSWLVAVLLWAWPVVALTLVSFVASPVAISRYFLTTAVGAALLVGYGASVVRGWLFRHRRHLGNRTTVFALLVAALTVLAPAPYLARPDTHTDTDTYEGHPAVDAALARMLHPGDVLVVRQGLSETGYAYGFAAELHDPAFERDAVRALVGGQPSAFVRRVVTVDGHRVSTAAAQAPVAHGTRVVVLGIEGESTLDGTGITGCRTTGRQTYRQTVVVDHTC